MQQGRKGKRPCLVFVVTRFAGDVDANGARFWQGGQARVVVPASGKQKHIALFQRIIHAVFCDHPTAIHQIDQIVVRKHAVDIQHFGGSFVVVRIGGNDPVGLRKVETDGHGNASPSELYMFCSGSYMDFY